MASIADSLKTSSINITNISKSLFETKRSVSSVNDSVSNISRIIATNTRIKRESFANTQIIESRRREASKRREIEDQLESSKVSSSPSQGLAFAGRSDKGPLGRLLGFLGFITAGWIVENLPNWIFMGKEFISRIQMFGRSMYNMVGNMQLIINSFGSVLKNSFNAIITLDFSAFTEGSVTQSFDELNLAVQSLGDDITETFRLFTTPLNESLKTGEQAPALDEDRPETMFPPAGGTNQDLYTLATITSLESGSQQGRADVAQSIYNRMKQSGQSATQVVTAPGQYSPFFAAPEEAKKIKTYDDAVNYLVKYKGYTRKTAETMIQSTLSAISNPQLQAEASRFIGARTSFRGSPQNYKSLPNVVFRGSSSDNQFLNEEVVQGGASAVPSFVSSQPSAPAKPTAKIPGKTPGYSQAVAFGKSLLSKGYKNIWQHPDFNWNSGYTGSGKERVAPRDYNSYHNYGEALDISAYNGEGKLDALYAELNKNKGKYGIAELLWRTKGHYDHLHISFNKTGATLTSSAPTAQISSPSRSSQPAAMTPQRKGSSIILIDDSQPQQSQASYSSQQSTISPTISESKLLNNFIKNKLLLDLAYL